MAKASASRRRQAGNGEETMRERILEAAFTAFKENGYAVTSTLAIATRAHVSKRELYALVGNKEEMLRACITARAKRLRVPAELPVPQDRQTLEQVLVTMGTRLLSEVSDPAVVAVFRLAIGEAVHAPEVARILYSIGIETSRTALRDILTQARASKLLDGRAQELVEEFTALLWGDLRLRLLLGVDEQPGAHEIAVRARSAATTFLRIHPEP